MNKNKLWVKAFRCVDFLILSILVGVLLMTAVYVLPVGRMHTKVDESRPLFENEGHGFYWCPPDDATTRLDGYTDCIMLQSAVYKGTGNPLKDAMLHARVEFSPEKWNPSESLIRYVYGEYEGPVLSYARYWGGYLLFLKPLLLFFTLPQIRAMDACFQMCLTLAVLLLAYRKGGLRLTVPMALMIAALNPITTAMSLQYTSMYLITLGGALVMLHLETWDKDWGYLVFLFLGIATAFFDFLTYPAAAVGVCLTIQVLLGKQRGPKALVGCIGSGAAWAFGYGGMWSGKWLAASLITGQNVLSDAMTQVQYRSNNQLAGSEGAGQVGLLQVILKNLSAYKTPAYILLALALVAAVLWLLLRKGYGFRPEKGLALPMLLCFLVPFVWYALIQNHSAVHYWMTHRNLCAAILALSGFIAYSLHTPQEVKTHG